MAAVMGENGKKDLKKLKKRREAKSKVSMGRRSSFLVWVT